jgi:hypothetical protein
MGRTLFRIEEDGRNWLRRPKLCTKSCTALRRRRRVLIENLVVAKLLKISPGFMEAEN